LCVPEAGGPPEWRHAIIGHLAIRQFRALARAIVLAGLIHVFTSAALCQTVQSPLPPAGQIVDVTCEGDSAQSYALYLPSTYSATKRWPLIYFFDPGGLGRRPLELYKDLAEKYGFVMAGSNNSRNFSSDQSRILNALWVDTHRLFALDARLTYVSGFSGGARVAGLMALNCAQCQIAGVIAHGAGYPSHRGEAKDKLLYFFAVGDQDFNWPEVVTVRREREDKGLAYRVRVFSGRHQWAPAEVMEDAIEWITLRAIQAGDRSPDGAFIDRQLRLMQADAEDAEKKNDAMAELAAYRSLVSDFSGLGDVPEAEKKLAALKKSAALKAALKKEQEQIDEQAASENEISGKLHAYISGSAEDEATLASTIVQEMHQLDDQAEHSKNEAKRLVARRAFAGLVVEGIESGQEELESRHFGKAETCFDLMSKVSDSPWPVLLLAETYAAEGNKKQALRELKEAMRRGVGAEAIESNDRLQILKTDPEFQKLVQAAKAK
jgi:dienelactone hydrolase